MFDWERDVYQNKLFRMELAEVLENDKAKASQKVKATGYADEELKVIRLQPHGFTSWPKKGALGFGLSVQGRRDVALSLGFETPGLRKPHDFKEGGSQLYDAEGGHITLDGKNPGQWAIKGPLTVTVGGNLTFKVTGDVIIDNTGFIKLGGTGTLPRVITEDGPSDKVRAKVAM